MCRATTDPNGGRRCLFHVYGRRINTLNATITRKEQELAELMEVKMKTADIKRRLRETLDTLERKRSYLADKENEYEALKKDKGREDAPEVQEVATTIKTTRTEIQGLEKDYRTLQDELNATADVKAREALRRRERDLIALLDRKRADLAELEQAYAQAKSEVEDKKPLTKTERIYVPRPVGDEVPMKLSLTPSELEQVKKSLGENEDLTAYTIRTAMTTEPEFTDREALDYDQPRKHGKGTTIGRPSAVIGEHKDATINIREEVAGRGIIRAINTDIATSYGLGLNEYLRRRVVGIDLYAPERDRGYDHNHYRITNLAAAEDKAGITNAKDIAEARREQYRQRFADAVRKAEEKYGADKVREVFYLHGLNRD